MWESDEPVPTRESAIAQDTSAFASRKLLLDGQQRLTSLTAVINGEKVKVRGRKRPVEILFNLEHPEGPPTEVTEVDEDEQSPLQADDEIDDESADDGDDGPDGDAGKSPAERFAQRTFVVASRALQALPNWVPVSTVFKASDAEILERAGIEVSATRVTRSTPTVSRNCARSRNTRTSCTCWNAR